MARIQGLINFIQPDNAVQSSVLILLYPMNTEIGLVLMRRPDYIGIHSGQISFPGGKYEDDDKSLIYTALREANEEIGIDPILVQILGQLTELYIPPSNFLVTPVVGYMPFRPQFKADPKEVAAIIEIRISDLLNKSNIQKKKIKLRHGLSLKVPSFFIDDNIIWGATAMILSEFRIIIQETGITEP
ncbi:MAG: CoA pyrophosphatase [Bacteroidales bacterium]|nr:CoA pyrophosphatase [Bacteroidales bacterium]